jgi:predicted Zn-dependent protease with MMP-like domain
VTEPGDPDPDAIIDALFDAAIARAIDQLPAEYAARLGSVAIVVEDEPTEVQLASVGAVGLFGLYQGVPRTTFGAENVPVPSKITIFRGPLVRSQRGDPRSLGAAVEETVLHEIAHHFGLSDARLLELRRRA